MAVRTKLRQKEMQVMDLFRVLIKERPSELCMIDQNSKKIHNLQSPDEKKNIGATISIGLDIQCLPYAGFYIIRILKAHFGIF